MQLVEVIPGFRTAEDTVTATLEHCRRLGKTPIRVKDVAGFAVNRMLHAFIIEAVKLVEEGGSTPVYLDTAFCIALSYPLWPCALMDAATSYLGGPPPEC